MSRYLLEHLANDSLLDRLHSLVERNRTQTADLLAHIAEVDRRRLYAEMGYPSMRAYCIQVLHLSEDAAAKRTQVARKARYLPVIFEAIADGRVHLSGMTLLAPYMDEENVEELIEAATHCSKAEIEVLLAERFPQPEPEEGVEHAPGHVRNRSGIRPIAPGKYVVQYTVGEVEYERLQYALQLMSHRNPKGSLHHLNTAAVELLIEQLEKDTFGTTDDPRRGERLEGSRYIPRSVKRAVWDRDGGRCTYVSPSGRRCECRWRLQYDHVLGFALGGESTVDNLRLLCPAHNQYAAECTFGVEFMEQKRRGSGRDRSPQGGEHAPGHAPAPASRADAGSAERGCGAVTP